MPHGGTHEEMVANVAKFMRPGTYVEIGTAHGATFRRVKEFCGRALGVDGTPVDIPEVECCDSLEFIHRLPNDSVDMAFIDADHQSDRAFADFVAIDPKMRRDSVVLLHDVWPPDDYHLDPGLCHDSWKVPGLIRARGGWDVVVLSAEYGLALCTRKREGPEWLSTDGSAG